MTRAARWGVAVSFLILVLLAIGGVLGFAIYQFRQTQRGQSLLAEADTAMRLAHYEGAIAKFDAALSSRLNQRARSDALCGRGFCYIATGRSKEALRDYTEAIRLNPKSAWAFQARGLLRASLGENDKAFADYSEAIRLDPNSGEALHGRGLTFIARRKPAQAIADLREAIRTLPDQAPLYLALADAQMQQNDWPAALNSLNVAIGLDPNLATAYAKRSEVHRLRGDWEKAMTDTALARSLDPNSALNPATTPTVEYFDKLLAGPLTSDQASVSYAYRGALYLEKNDLDHAIRDFDQAIAENAKNAGAYLNRAIAYNRKKDWKHSIPDFEKAIQLDPPGVELALNNLAWLRATNSNESLRNGPEAVKLATKACELTKWKHAGNIDTLAAAYAEAGDFEKAVKTQEQAIASVSADDRIRGELESRIALYRESKPYRE